MDPEFVLKSLLEYKHPADVLAEQQRAAVADARSRQTTSTSPDAQSIEVALTAGNSSFEGQDVVNQPQSQSKPVYRKMNPVERRLAEGLAQNIREAAQGTKRKKQASRKVQESRKDADVGFFVAPKKTKSKTYIEITEDHTTRRLAKRAKTKAPVETTENQATQNPAKTKAVLQPAENQVNQENIRGSQGESYNNVVSVAPKLSKLTGRKPKAAGVHSSIALFRTPTEASKKYTSTLTLPHLQNIMLTTPRTSDGCHLHGC